MATTKHYSGLLLLSLCAGITFAEGSSLSESEIEQRYAASAFVFTREANIPALIWECSPLLKGTSLNVELIFRGWYERNKPELEAAYFWTINYMQDLKEKNPEMHQRASVDLTRSVTSGALQSLRPVFKRQLPSQSACEWIVKTYSIPQLDFKNMGRNPGYEQFGEFANTLARIRDEPGFKPPTLQNNYELASTFRAGLSNIITLDAAEASKERNDGQGMLRAYQSLATRGDGGAAQTIGLMYFNGGFVPKSSTEAYRWFYAAWSLGEHEGLNAMGVMFRDGMGVSRDYPLAQAAFMVASVAARNKLAHDRAQSNADRLRPQIDAEAVERLKCLSIRSLDSELKKPVQSLPALVAGKEIVGAERKIGTLIPEWSSNFKPESCK